MQVSDGSISCRYGGTLLLHVLQQKQRLVIRVWQLSLVADSTSTRWKLSVSGMVWACVGDAKHHFDPLTTFRELTCKHPAKQDQKIASQPCLGFLAWPRVVRKKCSGEDFVAKPKIKDLQNVAFSCILYISHYFSMMHHACLRCKVRRSRVFPHKLDSESVLLEEFCSVDPANSS